MEYCTTRLVPSLNIWAVHICPFLRVKCKPAWTEGGGGGGGGSTDITCVRAHV